MNELENSLENIESKIEIDEQALLKQFDLDSNVNANIGAKAIIPINIVEIKKLISLTNADHIDVLINDNVVYFLSLSEVDSSCVFLTNPIDENTFKDGKFIFRIKKQTVCKLFMTGYLVVECIEDNRIKLNFTHSPSVEGRIVRILKQVVDSSIYKPYLQINIEGYPEIDVKKLSPMIKIANIFNRTLSVIDDVANIKIDETTFVFQQVKCANISALGKVLKHFTGLEKVYKKDNFLVGKNGNLTFVALKKSALNFADYDIIMRCRNNYIFKTKLNLESLASLSKEMALKNAKFILDFENNQALYFVEDEEYSIPIDAENTCDNMKVIFPSWLAQRILYVFKDQLKQVEISVYKETIILDACGFSVIFSRRNVA